MNVTNVTYFTKILQVAVWIVFHFALEKAKLWLHLQRGRKGGKERGGRGEGRGGNKACIYFVQ
jgi:hypothetical protein